MVSITSNPNYHQQEINQAIKTHFERFRLAERLRPEMKVLIKPNLLMKRRPEEFTTTHPSLVEAAIIALKEYGITQITVADSPGGLYTPAALKGIYEATGMRAVCERQQVRLNEDVSSQEVRREQNHLVKSFPLITPVCEADFILDICKLKSHAMTGLSGGVKNLFGCIPGLTKPEFHWRFPDKELFCQMLVDLCETIRPGFVLVDAVVSMEGDGPSGGTMRESGLILASDQIYDLDLCLCRLIGCEPDQIFTVKTARNWGLSARTWREIEIVGEPLQPLVNFQLPHDKSLDFVSHLPKCLQTPVKLFTQSVLCSRPVVRKKDCIGCGKCAESCPAKTIQIKNRTAKVIPKDCIHCFCCHEMCPVKAIDIKRSRLFSRKERGR